MMFKVAILSLLSATAAAEANHQVRGARHRSLTEEFCADFEEFETGQRVTEIDAGDGVFVTVTTDRPNRFPVLIFDTAEPTGDDFDLGTPNQCTETFPGSGVMGPGVSEDHSDGCNPTNVVAQGKVLIINERNTGDPDDNLSGGLFFFDFSREVTLSSIGILDVDANEGATITLEDSSAVVLTGSAALVEDNGFERFDLSTSGVRRMEVSFTGSGAITDFCFTPRESPVLTGCETAYARCGDDSECFPKNWGWTNPFTGHERCTLYAGAGQCDLEKGAIVGFADINAGSVEIFLDDDVASPVTHFYVGEDKFPVGKNGKVKIAPGQFPYKSEPTVPEFDLDEDMGHGDYFILHLEVCPK